MRYGLYLNIGTYLQIKGYSRVPGVGNDLIFGSKIYASDTKTYWVDHVDKAVLSLVKM